MKSFSRILLFASIVVFLISCAKEGPVGEQNISEAEQIENYLSENNIQAQMTSSGLYYTITAEGEGRFPGDDDFVSFFFRGYTLNDAVFNTNLTGNPVTIALSDQNIIRGLTEGLRFFKVGSTGTLYIPSSLAFGSNGGANGAIPPNTPIAYDLEVVDIFTEESKLQDNIAEIEQYLADNDLEAAKTASNLYFIIETEGDGEHPTESSTVTVDYHGFLTNGEVFDSSRDRGEPASFSLSSVIQGWKEGIPLLSRGGTGTLLIPHTLAYGANPPQGSIIPLYAVLIFEVELQDF